MTSYLDLDRFVAMLKTKRGRQGLRETAKAIGDVSASTLSRIENGKVPDLDIFLQICDWMGVSPDEFMRSDEETTVETSTPEIIEAHLRADKNLDERTAEAIAEMVRAAYNLNKRSNSDVDN